MNRDPYQRISKIYDRVFESMNAGLIGLGLKMFPPQSGMAILDVGCGTGSQLAAYQWQEADCVLSGIDASASMLDVARKKLGNAANLHFGDATEMPYENDSFDLVTTTLLLHELHPATRELIVRAKLTRQAYNALSPATKQKSNDTEECANSKSKWFEKA